MHEHHVKPVEMYDCRILFNNIRFPVFTCCRQRNTNARCSETARLLKAIHHYSGMTQVIWNRTSIHRSVSIWEKKFEGEAEGVDAVLNLNSVVCLIWSKQCFACYSAKTMANMPNKWNIWTAYMMGPYKHSTQIKQFLAAGMHLLPKL